MKHIKSYTQHINENLEEGLIKTYDIRSLIKAINKMNSEKGYLDIIGNSKVSINKIILILGKSEEEQNKVVDFSNDLTHLLNITGYYIASVDYKGGNMDAFKPKNNGEFLKIIIDGNKNEDVRAFQIDIEPKFQEEVKHSKILFHITEKKHLDKILKQGLVPRSKQKLSYHPERVYLADDYAIAHIYDRYKEFVKEPIILEVNTEGLKLYKDVNGGMGAFFSTDNISSDRISVLKENPDKFVENYFEKHDKDELNIDDIFNMMTNMRNQHA